MLQWLQQASDLLTKTYTRHIMKGGIMSENTTEQTAKKTRRNPMSNSTFGNIWTKGVMADKSLLEIVDDLGLDPSDESDVVYVRQKSTQLRKYIEDADKEETGLEEATKTLPKLTNMAPRRAKLDYSSFAVAVPTAAPAAGDDASETPAE